MRAATSPLGHQRQLFAASAVDQRHLVRVAAETRTRVAQRVEHDEVEVLAAHLVEGVVPLVVRFECETDQQPVALHPACFRCDILRAFQADDHFAVPFLDFCRTDLRRSIVGHCCAHHGAVRLRETFHHCTVHLFGGEYVDAFGAGRSRKAGTAAHECDMRSAGGECAGYRIAHLPGGVVGEKAYGVQRLDGRACRNDEVSALERHGQGRSPRTCSMISSGSAMRPFPVRPLASSPEPGSMMRTPRFRSFSMFSCVVGVGVHVEVHGRSESDRAACRQIACQQQVVGDSVGHFPDGVGRGGRD